jgi:hypothetical protein
MAFTKKQTALALATAVAIQALAYGGYRWMNYPADKEGVTHELDQKPGESDQDYHRRLAGEIFARPEESPQEYTRRLEELKKRGVWAETMSPERKPHPK